MSNGPSCHIDQSHYETSYEKYTNQGYHASGHGKFTFKQTTNYQHGGPSSPLEELEKHCSHSAAFDSAARFDPPRCDQSTRLRINRTIEEWIDSDVPTASLFWLYGGVGVGKSAVAQSLSEKFQEKEQLAASFFFFRGDATRNNGDHLIPTLVSHLVDSLKGISPFVEDRIRQHRALFTKNYQIQIRELLVEPLLALKSRGTPVTLPRLIVIDGLDECENPDVQCELLRVIARAIPHIPYPLRFFITSRPETHITHVFDHDPDFQIISVRKYNLSDDPDADRDIREFLEKEFMEIRRVHCLGQHLPAAWPDPSAITSLVDRSSGHFIYASTVIRYIGSPKHRPDDRLEVILRLRPPREGDKPYAQLDALYTFIFQGVKDYSHLEKICLVLGMLYFQSREVGMFDRPDDVYITIEDLLGMKAGDLVLLLDPIISLVAVDDGQVRILHKSLFDYVLDFTRGGHLPLDLARVHEVAATYILEQRIVEGVCSVKIFLDFVYHCRYASPNDTLKDYLHSPEVPLTNSIKTEVRMSDDWDNEWHVQRIMWHFFRTLTREEFDPTGHFHEQYAAKWMAFLHSPLPVPTQSQISNVDWLKCWLKRKLGRSLTTRSKPQNFATAAEMDKWKRRLETELVQRKPANLPVQVNPVDIGMDPIKLIALIKREHDCFLAFTKKFFDHPNAIVSSIVFGDNLIHSYDLVINKHRDAYLHLRTYSRNSNAFFLFPRVRTHEEFSKEILGDLWIQRIEKQLISKNFQKYGIYGLD